MNGWHRAFDDPMTWQRRRCCGAFRPQLGDRNRSRRCDARRLDPFASHFRSTPTNRHGWHSRSDPSSGNTPCGPALTFRARRRHHISPVMDGDSIHSSARSSAAAGCIPDVQLFLKKFLRPRSGVGPVNCSQHKPVRRNIYKLAENDASSDDKRCAV
jgi:hypothetical protein